MSEDDSPLWDLFIWVKNLSQHDAPSLSSSLAPVTVLCMILHPWCLAPLSYISPQTFLQHEATALADPTVSPVPVDATAAPPRTNTHACGFTVPTPFALIARPDRSISEAEEGAFPHPHVCSQTPRASLLKEDRHRATPPPPNSLRAADKPSRWLVRILLPAPERLRRGESFPES